LCEGRDLIGQSGKGDKKREVAGTSCGAVTGDVPGTERANRAIVAELVPRWEAERAGLTVAIRIVIGVLSWVMGPLDVAKLADFLEGKLMRAEGRRVQLEGALGDGGIQIAVILTASEAAALVEELRRAEMAIEREDPDARDYDATADFREALRMIALLCGHELGGGLARSALLREWEARGDEVPPIGRAIVAGDWQVSE